MGYKIMETTLFREYYEYLSDCGILNNYWNLKSIPFLLGLRILSSTRSPVCLRAGEPKSTNHYFRFFCSCVLAMIIYKQLENLLRLSNLSLACWLLSSCVKTLKVWCSFSPESFPPYMPNSGSQPFWSPSIISIPTTCIPHQHDHTRPSKPDRRSSTSHVTI